MSYFYFLFAGLALAVIGIALRTRVPRAGHALLVLGCVCSGASVAWQCYRFFQADSPKAPDRYHAVVGYMMGQYVARDLGGRQGEVCLIFPPDTTRNQDALDTLYLSFARVLQPLASLKLKETALKTNLKLVNQGKVAPATFEEVFASRPAAVAFVSFAGVPLEPEKLSILNRKEPAPFYVFDPTSGTAWKSALNRGLIRRVIVPRPEEKLLNRNPIAGPPEEIFKQFFLSASSETADQVAAQLKSQ